MAQKRKPPTKTEPENIGSEFHFALWQTLGSTPMPPALQINPLLLAPAIDFLAPLGDPLPPSDPRRDLPGLARHIVNWTTLLDPDSDRVPPEDLQRALSVIMNEDDAAAVSWLARYPFVAQRSMTDPQDVVFAYDHSWFRGASPIPEIGGIPCQFSFFAPTRTSTDRSLFEPEASAAAWRKLHRYTQSVVDLFEFANVSLDRIHDVPPSLAEGARFRFRLLMERAAHLHSEYGVPKTLLTLWEGGTFEETLLAIGLDVPPAPDEPRSYGFASPPDYFMFLATGRNQRNRASMKRAATFLFNQPGVLSTHTFSPVLDADGNQVGFETDHECLVCGAIGTDLQQIVACYQSDLDNMDEASAALNEDFDEEAVQLDPILRPVFSGINPAYIGSNLVAMSTDSEDEREILDMFRASLSAFMETSETNEPQVAIDGLASDLAAAEQARLTAEQTCAATQRELEEVRAELAAALGDLNLIDDVLTDPTIGS